MTKTESAKIYWHGDITSGSNRWFDKSMQFLFQSNGKLGFVGEHAMADGMPVVALCNRIKNLPYESLKKECHSKMKNEDNCTVDDDVQEVLLPVIQNIFEDAFIGLDTEGNKSIARLLDKGMWYVFFLFLQCCYFC